MKILISNSQQMVYVKIFSKEKVGATSMNVNQWKVVAVLDNRLGPDMENWWGGWFFYNMARIEILPSFQPKLNERKKQPFMCNKVAICFCWRLAHIKS